MCDICCEFFIFQQNKSLNVHSLSDSVSHITLLKWEAPTFILSGLWPQHTELNPVNYKICAGMQQRLYLKKVHNVHGLTLWLVWHCFEPRISNNVTED